MASGFHGRDDSATDSGGGQWPVEERSSPGWAGFFWFGVMPAILKSVFLREPFSRKNAHGFAGFH
jgi:hypothetical protein